MFRITKRMVSAVGIGTLAQIAGCDGCDGYTTDPTPLKIDAPAQVVAGKSATFGVSNQGTGGACPAQAAFTFRYTQRDSTVVVRNPPTAVGQDGACRVTTAAVTKALPDDPDGEVQLVVELLGPDFKRAAGQVDIEVLPSGSSPTPTPTPGAGPTPVSGFKRVQVLDAGANPTSVDVADYNGAAADGVGVAVVSDEPTGAPAGVRVFNFAGNLLSSASTLYTLPIDFEPSELTSADFTGDGDRDLAVAGFHASTVNLLEGASNGVFADPVAVAGDFRNPLGLATGDINGDNRTDLVTASPSAFGIAVALNTTAPAGASSFAAPVYFESGSTAPGSEAAPHAVAVGDLTRDGLPDVVVADPIRSRVSLLRNTTPAGAPAPSFAPFELLTQDAGRAPRDLVISDFDNDGAPDLAVANQGRDTVSLLASITSPGASAFTFVEKPYAVGNAPQAITPMRVGSNPQLDLAVANYGSGDASVLVDLGSGTPEFRLPAEESPVGIASGDINKDGRGDVAVANNGEPAPQFRQGSLSVSFSGTDQRRLAALPARAKGKRIRTSGSIDFGKGTTFGKVSFKPNGTAHAEGARIEGRMRLTVAGKRLPGEPKGLRPLLKADLAGTVDFDRYIDPADNNPVLARGVLAGRSTKDRKVMACVRVSPVRVAGKRIQRLKLLGATGKASRLRLTADIAPLSLDVDPTVTRSNRPLVTVGKGAKRRLSPLCRRLVRGL